MEIISDNKTSVNSTPVSRPRQQEGNGFNLKSVVALVLSKWYWFLISLAVTIGAATLYLMKTTPQYTRTASLLIKNEGKDGSVNTSVDMSELGFVQNNTNLENEIRIVKSPSLMKDVVERLDLNDIYVVKEGLRDVKLYKQSPVLFAGNEASADTYLDFDFKLTSDKKVEITGAVIDGKEMDKKVVAALGDTVRLANVALAVIKPDWDASRYVGKTISYSHTPVKATAASVAAQINAVVSNDKTSIIDISISCPSVQEADDILETLIQVYNEHWIRDKNQIAVSTSRFIDERLGVIEKELGNVDSDISSYKSAHLLPDVDAASAMYMSQSAASQTAIAELNNQLSVAEMVRRELAGENFSQPLPTNTGIINADIQDAISQYNATVLDRNRLLETTSEINPIVKDRTQTLRTLHGNIQASLNSYIATLRTQMSNARQQSNIATGKIAANPNQAKYLLSVERQQKVKEQLYLFLLQKREENELTQAFTAYNTSMIEESHGSPSPTSPIKSSIYLMAIVVGLVIPLLILILREMLDTKIRGKKDLQSLTIPYLGEIPSAVKKARGFDRLKKKKPETHKIVVKGKSRNAINEAFRVLRTNLEYIGFNGPSADKCKVIAITSANPGSGKTFISINLAKVLAIKGKKVLVIDLDLRKGSLSKLIGSKEQGISDYLVGRVDEQDLFFTGIDDTPTLDAITVGTVPPNPAELLSSENLDRLIDRFREEYDFIVLDCPPVEIVTDAKVINRLVDLTVFVIRAGLLEKDELPNIQEYYDESRYRNMAILLNATDIHSGYGYHRYGYHYGYHYGSYGTGYYGSDK